MAKGRATGVVLEGDRLEWVDMVLSGERIRRTNQGIESLSPEPAAPAGDSAEARRALVERLRAACAGIKGDAVLGLPSASVLLRVVDLPPVPDDELAEMVELQADKFVPFPIETMAVSHEVLARSDKGCRVVVAAARDDAVEAVGGLLVAAGRRPVCVDSCALGWWRLLCDAGGVPAAGRVALVVMPGTTAELIVVQDGVPLVFRSLAPGAGMDPAGIAGEMAQELRHTLISLELEHGSQPCAVSLWACEDRLSVIEQTLGRAGFELTAHALDPLPSVCEGLARRRLSGGGIDLTPRAWREADSLRRSRRRMMGGLVGVLAVWLVCLVALVGMFGWRRAAISRLQARRKAWEQPAMEVRELRRRVLMIERYTDTSHSSLECLREVSGLQPVGVDLVSFTYTKGDAIRIVGQARERSLIYGFKEALDGSGFFPSAELGSQVQDRKTQQWSFDMALKLPAEEAP